MRDKQPNTRGQLSCARWPLRQTHPSAPLARWPLSREGPRSRPARRGDPPDCFPGWGTGPRVPRFPCSELASFPTPAGWRALAGSADTVDVWQWRGPWCSGGSRTRAAHVSCPGCCCPFWRPPGPGRPVLNVGAREQGRGVACEAGGGAGGGGRPTRRAALAVTTAFG